MLISYDDILNQFSIQPQDEIIANRIKVGIMVASIMMLLHLILNSLIFYKHRNMPYFIIRDIKMAYLLLISSFFITLIAQPIVLLSFVYHVITWDIRITLMIVTESISIILCGSMFRYLYLFVKIKRAQDSSEWKTALDENYTSYFFIYFYYRNIHIQH